MDYINPSPRFFYDARRARGAKQWTKKVPWPRISPSAMLRTEYKAPQRNNPEWIADLKTGSKMCLGCSINTSSSLVAEMVSATGYDFCLIDQQHSAVDPEKVRSMLQAIHCGGAKAFIRVGGCYDRVGIQQAFDLGADGLIVPCAQTVEDVKHAVCVNGI